MSQVAPAANFSMPVQVQLTRRLGPRYSLQVWAQLVPRRSQAPTAFEAGPQVMTAATTALKCMIVASTWPASMTRVGSAV